MSRALITGASSGIGAATARRLAREGYGLILAARREDRLRELAATLPADTICQPLDVRDQNSVSALMRSVPAAEISVLVNSAGLAKGTDKVAEADCADWDEMIDTNVKGLLYLTRAMLPFMLKAGRGHIVNLGSVAGRWVYPGGAVYCASKFAVRAISEGLRMDLLGSPVRVTNIEPGMVETEFSEVRLGDKTKAKQVYEGMKPLSAYDVADAIAWCLARPPHVNIQELVLFPTAQAAVGQVSRHR